MEERKRARVVVFARRRDAPPSRYEAACLEYDAQSVGCTVDAAMYRMEAGMNFGFEGAAGRALPAPRRYGGEAGMLSVMWEFRLAGLRRVRGPAARPAAGGWDLDFGLADVRSYREGRMRTEVAEAPDAGAERIRLIIFRESAGGRGAYVGQCLEYDHGTQAESIEGVISRIELGLLAEFRLLEGASREELSRSTFARPAPRRFEEMWEQRTVELTRAPRARPPGAGFRLEIALAALT